MHRKALEAAVAKGKAARPRTSVEPTAHEGVAKTVTEASEPALHQSTDYGKMAKPPQSRPLLGTILIFRGC